MLPASLACVPSPHCDCSLFPSECGRTLQAVARDQTIRTPDLKLSVREVGEKLLQERGEGGEGGGGMRRRMRGRSWKRSKRGGRKKERTI